MKKPRSKKPTANQDHSFIVTVRVKQDAKALAKLLQLMAQCEATVMSFEEVEMD